MKIMIKVIIIIPILCFLVIKTNGQDTSYTQIGKYTMKRSDYIDNLTAMINITPFIYAASNRFIFAANKKSIQYDPNEAPSIGLRLQHKWLGVSFTYGPKAIQNKDKGTSEYFNIVFNSYGKKIGFDIYYIGNKGYFVGNKKVMEDLNLKSQYLIRPDLQTKGLGFNTYYLFNHKKFSYRSSFLHNEIQKRTAGSFLLTFSGSYYKINADSSVVPTGYQGQIENISQLRSGSFITAGLMPGYALTVVGFKRFYATFSLSYGVMYQIQDYQAKSGIKEDEVRRNLWITRGLARVSAGFNSKYLYFGVSGVGDNYHIPLGAGNQLQYSIGNVMIFVGSRIKMPKKFSKVSDLMDKVPLIAEKKDK